MSTVYDRLRGILYFLASDQILHPAQITYLDDLGPAATPNLVTPDWQNRLNLILRQTIARYPIQVQRTIQTGSSFWRLTSTQKPDAEVLVQDAGLAAWYNQQVGGGEAGVIAYLKSQFATIGVEV